MSDCVYVSKEIGVRTGINSKLKLKEQGNNPWIGNTVFEDIVELSMSKSFTEEMIDEIFGLSSVFMFFEVLVVMKN